MNGSVIHRRRSGSAGLGANVTVTETATRVRWTEDGRLQQRWWIEARSAEGYQNYEEWRDVPTLRTSTG